MDHQRDRAGAGTRGAPQGRVLPARFTRMLVDALCASGAVGNVMADLVEGRRATRRSNGELARTMELAWRGAGCAVHLRSLRPARKASVNRAARSAQPGRQRYRSYNRLTSTAILERHHGPNRTAGAAHHPGNDVIIIFGANRLPDLGKGIGERDPQLQGRHKGRRQVIGSRARCRSAVSRARDRDIRAAESRTCA